MRVGTQIPLEVLSLSTVTFSKEQIGRVHSWVPGWVLGDCVIVCDGYTGGARWKGRDRWGLMR